VRSATWRPVLPRWGRLLPCVSERPSRTRRELRGGQWRVRQRGLRGGRAQASERLEGWQRCGTIGTPARSPPPAGRMGDLVIGTGGEGSAGHRASAARGKCCPSRGELPLPSGRRLAGNEGQAARQRRGRQRRAAAACAGIQAGGVRSLRAAASSLGTQAVALGVSGLVLVCTLSARVASGLSRRNACRGEGGQMRARPACMQVRGLGRGGSGMQARAACTFLFAGGSRRERLGHMRGHG